MNRESKYQDIRKLLERWYSGETSREEEKRLEQMLLFAPSLPPDLEADRKVFEALRQAAAEPLAEMPSEYSERINAALEKEMKKVAGDDMGPKRGVPGWFSSRRLRLALGGVAVILAGVFITNRMMHVPEIEMPPQPVLAMHNPSTVTTSDDTTYHHNLVLKADEELKDNNNAKKSVINRDTGKLKKSKASTVIAAQSGSQVAASDEIDETLYLSEEEEERLARSKYRIVRDEAEAEAILSPIFSKLETNIAMETSRLSRIELEHQSEMIKVTELSEYNGIKDINHEYTPI